MKYHVTLQRRGGLALLPIPKAMLRQLALRAGSKVRPKVVGRRLVVVPVRHTPLEYFGDYRRNLGDWAGRDEWPVGE